MKKRLLALILAGVLLVGSAGAAFTATKTYAPGQFTDVTANAWYAASVKKVYELNLMNGSSTTTFNPGGMFTVAEALTVAGRMHSLAHGGSGVLPTASGAWYQNAVDYCTKNKLITADQFDSYTRAATRAEMAGVIRAALPDDQWKAINSVSALPDVNMGNEYAQAIFDLYNAGVFTGSDDYGMFQPYAYITRAEVAAIVARCADPSQRKTLNLKPLSQRQAPELLGGYKSDRKMSNGRLAYQDPTSKKWGYLDGNGTAVIPAQYDSAEDFEGGYAKVGTEVGRRKYKYGLINTAGTAVIPVENDSIEFLENGVYWVEKGDEEGLWSNGRFVTDLGYDNVYSNRSNDCLGNGLYGVSTGSKYGVVDINGKFIVPLHDNSYYTNSFIGWTGIYGYGSRDSQSYDIYDQNGVKLTEGVQFPVKGNPLLAVREGNKYAVATPKGKITEAVYDSVKLALNSPYATVKYGDLTGLVGMNGELIAPGTYSDFVFNGDYFATQKKGSGDQPSEVMVGDTTGIIRRYAGNWSYHPDEFFVYEDRGSFLVDMGWNGSVNTGVFFQKDGTGKSVSWAEDGSIIMWSDEGEYLMNETGKTFGPRYDYIYSYSSSYYSYIYEDRYTWEDEDGTHTKYSYGIWDKRGELSEPIYDSKSEANAAYKEYKAKPEQESKKYDIRTSDAGKPIVAYGNDTTGWTNVIEFYKNNMYYDEIKDIGEGYYACRFNTTWYLLHA